MDIRLVIGIGVTLALSACVPLFDATPSSTFSDTSTPDVGLDAGGDTALDVHEDTDQDVGTLNACGGELDLRLNGLLVEPSYRCGECDDGSVVCNGPNTVRCVGATEPNECGECFDLGGAVEQSCGPCGEGVLQCAEDGALLCVGDAPVNACDGCGSLQGQPGSSCFISDEDGAGTWVCDGGGVVCRNGVLNACGGDEIPLVYNGNEAELESPCDGECGDGRLACSEADANMLICSTQEDARANSCGGCSALPGNPGDDCGRCGTWECDGEEGMQCVNEEPNSCGGCIPLTVELGEPCEDGTRAICVGDVTNCGAGNGCGGDRSLGAVPGETCGPCSTWQCDGTEAVACVGSDENECGGCLPLPGFGQACGTCGTGELRCQGRNGLRCEDEELDSINECGGCSPLDGEPGDDCGDCGGQLQCSSSRTDLICSASENACGGCGPLGLAIGDSCESECGAGQWICRAGSGFCTPLDEELNECGTCGPVPALYGEPCGCSGTFECNSSGLYCSHIACGGIEECGDGCGATRCKYGYCQPTLPGAVELITADERPNGDEFGFAIASNSEWLVIGAPGTDNDHGRVYFFEAVVGAWTYRQWVELEIRERMDRFGHSVAINDANSVVIGTPGRDDFGLNAGACHVFERVAGAGSVESWALVSDPLGSASPGQALGTSVAWVEDGRFLAGAPDRGLSGGRTGAVAEFALAGDRWTVSNTLDATFLVGGVVGQGFGFSVAAHSAGAVIGAPESDMGDVFDAGAAFFVPRAGGDWLRGTTRMASVPEDSAFYGYQVAATASLEAVSAPYEDGMSLNEGAVYVYASTDDGVTTTTRMVPSDLEPEDAFGAAGLDIDSERIAVGSEWHDRDADDAGAVWVFEAPPGAAITLTRKFIHPSASAADRGGYLDLRADGLLYGATGNQVTSGGGAVWSVFSF